MSSMLDPNRSRSVENESGESILQAVKVRVIKKDKINLHESHIPDVFLSSIHHTRIYEKYSPILEFLFSRLQVVRALSPYRDGPQK